MTTGASDAWKNRRGRSDAATSAGLSLDLAWIQPGLGAAENRLLEPLEDLRVLPLLPKQAANSRADGPDLGRIAAAVRAHQQMESEREALPPGRGAPFVPSDRRLPGPCRS